MEDWCQWSREGAAELKRCPAAQEGPNPGRKVFGGPQPAATQSRKRQPAEADEMYVAQLLIEIAPETDGRHAADPNDSLKPTACEHPLVPEQQTLESRVFAQPRKRLGVYRCLQAQREVATPTRVAGGKTADQDYRLVIRTAERERILSAAPRSMGGCDLIWYATTTMLRDVDAW